MKIITKLNDEYYMVGKDRAVSAKRYEKSKGDLKFTTDVFDLVSRGLLDREGLKNLENHLKKY